MAYTADSIPSDHGEFSGGPGMIDPEVRKDREGLEPYQRLWEIYATNPAPADVARGAGSPGTVEFETALEERAAAIEIEQDPELVHVPRVQLIMEDEV